MSTPQPFFEVMRRGWYGGLKDGTVCGKGSTLSNTEAIRAWLPEVVTHYGIRSVCDAGAGDLHWVRHVQWNVPYIPVDLIPRHESVREIDITRELIPQSDLILCRFVLQHLVLSSVLSALDLFKTSGARYLAFTQYNGNTLPKGCENWHPMGVYNQWDFRHAPFSLGEPLASVADAIPDCYLSLWRVK